MLGKLRIGRSHSVSSTSDKTNIGGRAGMTIEVVRAGSPVPPNRELDYEGH